MRSTASDVARLAGVSVSTVSRALTVPDKVSTSTRLRVQEVARGLGYHPNQAARGLATGRTGNLGLVIPDLENPYFSSITKAVQSRARSVGYAVFVADTDEDSQEEPEIIRNLAKQVDGVILCSSRASDAELVDRAKETRVILLNREAADLPSVTADNVDGMRQAVRHLWALGHRDIAYVGGPVRSWSDSQRRLGFERAGAELEGVRTQELGAFQPFFSGGVAAADIVLASGATAVVVYNDLMALGLLERVKERGIVVGRELSVVSFDDIMLSAAITPRLTTVAVPIPLLARTAIDLLLGLFEDGAGTPGVARTRVVSLQHTIPVDLMVRGSTGPVPKPHRSLAR